MAAMGPDKFLSLLPLEMDKSDLASSRIWLLPILKQHMVGARLGFFVEHLLPLANQLRQRAKKVIAAACCKCGCPVLMCCFAIHSLAGLIRVVCNCSWVRMGSPSLLEMQTSALNLCGRYYHPFATTLRTQH